MKIIEVEYQDLPIIIKIRKRSQSKCYLLKSSLRKLAACLVGIEKPFKELLT